MFTGLVEETGRVTRLERTPEGLWRMTVQAGITIPGLSPGDSVATNGCCLTATAIAGDTVRFDLLDETMRRTSFAGLKEGSRVNLERSVTPSTRLGGHFVTGHVDATGTIEIFEPRGANHLLRVRRRRNF